MIPDTTKAMSRRNFFAAWGAALAGSSLVRTGPEGDATGETQGSGTAGNPRVRAYRILGRTGFKVADIGLGSSELIDPALLEAILDSGINYLDCAETYVGGQVERTFGRVLKHRSRKSVFLTTKIVVRSGESKASVKERALKCLDRLQTDFVDCFMMHAPATSAMVKLQGFHAAVQELKAEGRVRFCGISNHGFHYGDLPETMDQVLLTAAEDGRFDVMLLVYNFIQSERGERVLRACREKNIGAALMKTNPVTNYLEIQDQVDRLREQGRKPNPQIVALAARLKSVADQAEPFIRKLKLGNNRAIQAAAVKFVLANPAVHTACLTIKNTDDLRAFVGLSGQKLSPSELGLLRAYHRTFGPFYCRHACGLCEGDCPSGVPVNTIMRFAHYRAQGRESLARTAYAGLPGPRADRCDGCSGDCQAACPFGVPVQALLTLAHHNLTLG